MARAPYSKRGMKIICIGTRPRVQRTCRWISGCGPDGRPSSSTGMKSVRTTTPPAVRKVVSRMLVRGRYRWVEVHSHRGPDRPGAAPLRVQDGGEDAAAVEPREAAPVDRAVQPDQRRGAHVADQPVVGLERRAGRRRPAIRRVGRRIELEVRHRPKYNADA